jgi:hypothetical protein
LIGYTLPEEDGKRHRVDVRVNPPDLTGRARKSYIAPRSTPVGGAALVGIDDLPLTHRNAPGDDDGSVRQLTSAIPVDLSRVLVDSGLGGG